jgi:hypothetical protein
VRVFPPSEIRAGNLFTRTNLSVLAAKIIGGLDDVSLAPASAKHFDRNWKEVLDEPEISNWWSEMVQGLPRPVLAAGLYRDYDR